MEDQRTFLILANPMARRGAESLIDIVQSAAPPNATFHVLLTEPQRLSAGALIDQARGCEAVIAIGGDGTVAEAATGLNGENVAIGIIPSGSTNIVARNLGLPNDPESAARLIFQRKHTRRIDVGMCNGRRFLHMGAPVSIAESSRPRTSASSDISAGGVSARSISNHL